MFSMITFGRLSRGESKFGTRTSVDIFLKLAFGTLAKSCTMPVDRMFECQFPFQLMPPLGGLEGAQNSAGLGLVV